MTEWPKVRDWKSRVRQPRTVGSNPTLSAKSSITDAVHTNVSRGDASTPAALRSLRRSLRLRLSRAPCWRGASPRATPACPASVMPRRPSSRVSPARREIRTLGANLGNNRSLNLGWRHCVGLTERCRSGRTGRSRKPLTVQAVRGFESHPLRQFRYRWWRARPRVARRGIQPDGVALPAA